MRRAVVLLLLLASLSTFRVVPSAMAAPTAVPDAIEWRVDHKAMTITAHVRLWLYPAHGKRDRVNGKIASVIRDQILGVWNKGYTYGCYRLLFEVDVAFDNGSSSRHDFPNAVAVAIDRDGTFSISSTATRVSEGAPWDSDSPDDLIEPLNKSDNPKTRRFEPTAWMYPPNSSTTYAHELGHILGLDDAYDVVKDKKTQKKVKKPNAPDDLMSTGGKTIDPTTIDRLVRRNARRIGPLLPIAAGDWKGTFKLVYEPIIKGMPPGMHTIVTWAGEISFQVQAPDSQGPAGTSGGSSPLRGNLKGGLKADIAGIPMPGATAKANEKSVRDAVCELGAVTQDSKGKIQRIEVKGDPQSIGFTYNIEATSGRQRASKSGSLEGGTKGPIIVTYLDVDELQCDALRGHVDTARLMELAGGWITAIRVIESTWTAKRVEGAR